MIKKFIPLTILWIVVASQLTYCTIVNRNIPELQASTITLEPAITQTNTPTPTSTHTPTPTATSTPKPTKTPMPTLVLDTFVGELVGVGEHGSMACVEYIGNPDDLAGLRILADIRLGDKMRELNVPLESIDGKTCFEMIDTKYITEILNNGRLVIKKDPISLTIKFFGNYSFVNNWQEIDIGTYKQFPFLAWIFPIFRLNNTGSYSAAVHRGWDFSPGLNADYSEITQVPVFSPVSGFIARVNTDFPYKGRMVKGNGLSMYSPYTGFLVTVGHISDQCYIDGKPVDITVTDIEKLLVRQGEQITFIGPRDEGSKREHIHMTVSIPEQAITPQLSRRTFIHIINNINDKALLIDFVTERLFLDPNLYSIIQQSY